MLGAKNLRVTLDNKVDLGIIFTSGFLAGCQIHVGVNRKILLALP